MAEDSGPTDLLGDPWRELPDTRGRKRHKRDAQIAEKVSVLRATGLSVDRVALRVGLSEPTLRKYYLRELEDAETLAESVLTESMWARARAGNVAAARFIREQFDKGKAAVPLAKSAPVSEAKAPKLGKKETLDLEAQTAHEDTSWGNLLKH